MFIIIVLSHLIAVGLTNNPSIANITMDMDGLYNTNILEIMGTHSYLFLRSFINQILWSEFSVLIKKEPQGT